jgi:hypothetical protein
MLTEPSAFQAGSVALFASSWILTYMVHSTVLFAAAWILTSLLGSRLHPVKEVVWKVALVGALVTSTVQLGTGLHPFGGRLDAGTILGVAAGPEATPQAAGGAAGDLAEDPADDPVDVSAEAPDGVVADLRAEDPADVSSECPAEPHVRTAAEDPLACRTEGPVDDGADTPRGDSDDVAHGEMALEGSAPVAPLQTRAPIAAPVETPGDGSPEGRAENAENAENAADDAWFALSRGSQDRGSGTEESGEDQIGAAGSLSDDHDFAWPQFLLGLWILGTGVGLFRLASARVQLAVQLRGRRDLTEGPVADVLAGLCRSAGVKKPVRLTVSPRLPGPIAVGRSEICLPERVVTEFTPEQQEVLLAHELAHVIRRDSWWLVTSCFVCAVFFFQPLHRLARRQIREIAEYLCDDWAVEQTGRRLDLARCLAEVATTLRTSPQPVLASGMAHQGSPFLRRIDRLLQEPATPRSSLPQAARFGIALLLLGGMVSAAPGVGPVDEEPGPGLEREDSPAGLLEILPGIVPVSETLREEAGVEKPCPLEAAAAATERASTSECSKETSCSGKTKDGETAGEEAPVGSAFSFQLLTDGAPLQDGEDEPRVGRRNLAWLPVERLGAARAGQSRTGEYASLWGALGGDTGECPNAGKSEGIVVTSDGGRVIGPGSTPLTILVGASSHAAERPVIGVLLGQVGEALAAQLGIDADESTLILEVFEGLPAEEAGLEKYDIVTRVNRESSASPDELTRAIEEAGEGGEIRLEVLRKGRRKKFDVDVTARPLREVHLDETREWPEVAVKPVPAPRLSVRSIPESPEVPEAPEMPEAPEIPEAPGVTEISPAPGVAYGYRMGTEEREAVEAYRREVRDIQRKIEEQIKPMIEAYRERIERRIEESQPSMERMQEIYERELEVMEHQLQEKLEEMDRELEESLEPRLEIIEEHLQKHLEEYFEQLERRLEELERAG